MSLVTGPITWEGAVIDAFVRVSQAREALLNKHSLRVPAPVGVRLQIDTGSHLTVILSDVFKSLEIGPFSKIEVRTPSTMPGKPHIADQYDVRMYLVSAGTNLTLFPNVEVIASDDFDKEEGIQGVVGRNILDRCNLHWHGVEGNFHFGF